MTNGRTQVEVGGLEALRLELIRRDFKGSHARVVRVPGSDAWRNKYVVIHIFEVIIVYTKACEVIMTVELHDDLVSMVLEDVEVYRGGLSIPHLLRLVPSPRVHMTDRDELSLAVGF